MAVNVTPVPAHIAPEGLAARSILTGKFGFTVMLIALEVAGFPERQLPALEVRIHVTTSVLARVVLVYVVLFVPTLPPLSCH